MQVACICAEVMTGFEFFFLLLGVISFLHVSLSSAKLLSSRYLFFSIRSSMSSIHFLLGFLFVFYPSYISFNSSKAFELLGPVHLSTICQFLFRSVVHEMKCCFIFLKCLFVTLSFQLIFYTELICPFNGQSLSL